MAGDRGVNFMLQAVGMRPAAPKATFAAHDSLAGDPTGGEQQEVNNNWVDQFENAS